MNEINPNIPENPDPTPTISPAEPALPELELEVHTGPGAVPVVGKGVAQWIPDWEKPTEAAKTEVKPSAGLVQSQPGQRPDVVLLDGTTEWSEKAVIVGQSKDPNQYKFDKFYAKIFDLSDAAQLEAYNELVTRCTAGTDPSEFILSDTVEFVQKTGTWKVLVKVQKVLYKVVLKK